MLTITIDGETFNSEDCVIDVNARYAPEGGAEITIDGEEFLVFPDAKTAGKAARARWADMAENDPREFTCMVGESTLVAWGLGQAAGPGSAKVRSLSEWLDLHLDCPEEEFASYDGEEREVEHASNALVKELGFTPTVAYRTN